MGTICEIYNKKCQVILGRKLLSPASESDPYIPKQLDTYLLNVSREIYCGKYPIQFDSSTGRIGDDTFINMVDGTIIDVHGTVLFSCFDDYLLSNIEPTLLFLDSFV